MGQNFLIKESALQFIKNAISPNENKTYIEVGPGFMFLTELVAADAKEIIAIEKDTRFKEYYAENITRKNIKIVFNDALKIDFDIYKADELFGNIPYGITTDLIIKITRSKTIKRSVLLLQKEFAKRLLSPCNSKTYGAITVFVDFFFEKKFLKTFPPHFFYPKPSISSSLIELKRKENIPDIDKELFFKIVRSAFGKRRKHIVNALSSVFEKDVVINALKNAGIEPSRRAETLTLEEFERIYKFFKNY
jgi:16S rRNA (adenine1518-N6/adenine1519-N6)-dimethyltransferase